MSDLDEHLLLQRAGLGDLDAFGALVGLHQGRVRGFLRRLCRDHALADDLAQDCFLQAWRKLGDYREQGSFNAWLCSIAYRCFLQSLRKRRREDTAAVQYEHECTDEEAEGGTAHRSAREHRALERAMQALKPDEAAAITLHITLGYSHGDVASILSLPLGTVKSLIARGLPRLRAALMAPANGVNHEPQ